MTVAVLFAQAVAILGLIATVGLIVYFGWLAAKASTGDDDPWGFC